MAPYLGTPLASYLKTIWAPHIGIFGLPVWAPVVEAPAPYWFPIWASLLGPLAQAKHVRFLTKIVRMLRQVDGGSYHIVTTTFKLNPGPAARLPELLVAGPRLDFLAQGIQGPSPRLPSPWLGFKGFHLTQMNSMVPGGRYPYPSQI